MALRRICSARFSISSSRRVQEGHDGLGIGLALVRSLVELHGGTVHASSAGLGQGTQFQIRLPVLPTQPTPEARTVGSLAEPASPEIQESRRILVVDDSADAAESLATILRLLGHQVWVANEGAGALELTNHHHPEIVFLDLRLPGMGGLEIAGRLREKHPGLLLVAMTGQGSEDSRVRALAAGFDHFLVKPLDLDGLRPFLVRPGS